MKVLLINPSFDFKKFGRFERFMEPMPCLGLAYIAAVLEKNNIDVEIIDDFALRLGIPGILVAIKEQKYDIVGISCLTPSAPTAFSIAAGIKRYNGSILTVLGNIHATIFAEDILKKESLDVVVHGEGEYTMLELVKAVIKNSDFSNIKGISFKRDGCIVNTPPRELLTELERLPYPAWHLFPIKQYGFLPFLDVRKPGLSILGSRGCPYRCTFCSLPNTGSNYRKRQPQKIAEEFEYLIEHFPIKQVGFVDPVFPFVAEDGFKFCEELIRRKLNNRIVWTCETRVDKVNRALLKKMRQAGCRRILFGLESGVQELLDNIKKNYNLEDIRQGISYTRKEGIQAAGLFMIGLPGENKEMTQKTINFAKELDLDFAKFAITVPFPGSQLYEDLTRSGKLKRYDWENFITFNPDPNKLVYVPGKISPEDLINMQRKGHQEFYLRVKIIFRQIFRIHSLGIRQLLYGFFSLILRWTKNPK
jgi:radical SAM superfamily enzyme YgiQ (UPF0313 family)